MSDTFKLTILSPEGIAFSDQVRQVSARNKQGAFSILPHHAFFFTSLETCQIHICINSEKRISIPISGGLLEHYQTSCVIILTEHPPV